MFSLIKHECESCMEEHDCVHCSRCKSYYCRDCILDYNNCNKIIGLCPTCKSKYGMMNNYYIYGTNVLPLLSAQIDKYRERIQSNGSYQLQQLFEQLKTDNAKGICDKRSALLQLYLNRLYVDQHPSERESLHTWAKGVHEAYVILDIFDDFRFAVEAFLANHPDDIIRQAVLMHNKDFDHVDWYYPEQQIYGEYSMTEIFVKRIDGPNPLTKHIYRDHLQEHTIEERGMVLTDYLRGVLCALVISGKDQLCIEGEHYQNTDLKPHVGEKAFNPRNRPLVQSQDKPAGDASTFTVQRGRFDTAEYVVFKVYGSTKYIHTRPTVCDIRDTIGTSDYDRELLYYRSLAITIGERIDKLIDQRRSQNKTIDDSYYHLLHSIAAIKGYTNPDRSSTEIEAAKALKNAMLELVNGESFNIPTFLAMLDAYYPLDESFSFVEDLKPITDAIRLQLFKDIATADAFDKAVRPLLKLNEKPSNERFSMRRGETMRFVTLPDTLNHDLKDALAKSDSKHKLSFVRCVCGGSVIATTNGASTVYECTRCHKQLDALPEQEIDPETAKLLESISKKCPVCGTYIQKAAGCNHMFCINCKNGFNWDDLSHLDDAHNTNPHFREHRHGNVSNLRSLLDDYNRPANRTRDPIEWFGNTLYVDMKDAEKAIKDHRESAGKDALKFIRDDAFAMKFANALNIKKMCVNYIQSTFDKVMAEAFSVVRENGNDQRALLTSYRKIVNRSLRDYENGKTMLVHIQDGLAARIDYAIEEAHRTSQVSEPAELVTDEMEAEALAMEEAMIAQLSARIEEMEKHTDDTIVIGGRRINVIRSQARSLNEPSDDEYD